MTENAGSSYEERYHSLIDEEVSDRLLNHVKASLVDSLGPSKYVAAAASSSYGVVTPDSKNSRDESIEAESS